MTIDEFKNGQWVDDKIFVVHVMKHKTTKAHGAVAVLILRQTKELIDGYMAYVRPLLQFQAGKDGHKLTKGLTERQQREEIIDMSSVNDKETVFISDGNKRLAK